MRKRLCIALLVVLTLVAPQLSGCSLPFAHSKQVAPGALELVEHGALAAGRAARESAGPDRLLETARLVRSLSTEQKVAQLFFVRPESLVRDYTDVTVTASGEVTRRGITERPVGGIIYFAANLIDTDQTTQMIAQAKQYALEACGIPLLVGVDEEGGTVLRVGGRDGFGIEQVGNMSDVGATGDVAYGEDVASFIGSYLRDLGFTTNLAPVADIADNPEATLMTWRSFGSDPELVASMVAAQVRGFRSQGVISCVKHFPGLGGSVGDPHSNTVYIHKSLDEMEQRELVPFAAAIEESAPMIMVGHVSWPEVIGSDLPASISSVVMRDLLRERMGFKGVIITDSLDMAAIVAAYGQDRLATEVFLAGADALLMPSDFDAAYAGVLDAVYAGEISEERLNQSVFRIVWMKLSIG